ncbi:ABC transporter substrate-binding protein [Halovivax cerinus]|uniref:ABC transporter substrate-binding protein n=1 Tax=Halovivax cerinus TaxID=1487865 RepID=A0ABD5NS34_9EURY|nr:ABC transporter substrate-binding protein [Halovivax cerinus]
MARILGSSQDVSRRRFLQATGASTAIGLAGCVGGDDGDSIKVGVPMPLSGPAGQTGEFVQGIYEFIVDEVVNRERPDLAPLTLAEEAGLPNHGNAEVEALFVDHRADPGEGRAEAEQLIEGDDVAMIIGAIQSPVTQSIGTLAATSQVPMVTSSTAPDLINTDNEWLWRPTPSDAVFAASQVEFAAARSDPAVETGAVVYEDSEFGSSAAREHQGQAQEAGIEIVEDISYTAEELTSFEAQTDVLASADPDVVFLTSHFADGILILETFQEREYMPRLLNVAGDLSGPEFYSERAELASNITMRSTYSDELQDRIPGVEAFAQALNDEAEIEFGGIPSRVTTMFQAALTGLDRAGSTDPQEIQAAMNDLEMSNEEAGAAYGVEFDERGQNTLASALILQAQDGGTRIVWPEDLVDDNPLVYPLPEWSG